MLRFICFLLLLPVAVNQISAAPLKGRVKADDGKALSGVSITILQNSWTKPVTLKSAADGSFNASVDVSKIARVEFVLRGYRTMSFTGGVLQDGEMQVAMKAVGAWGNETVLNERLYYRQQAAGLEESLVYGTGSGSAAVRHRSSAAGASGGTLKAVTVTAAPSRPRPSYKAASSRPITAEHIEAMPTPDLGAAYSTAPASDELRSGSADKADRMVPSGSSAANTPSAGKLTSGEVADFNKWQLWQDMDTTEMKSNRATWKLFPTHRYTIQLQNSDGSALSNAYVRLHHSGARDTVWAAWTDNTGKAELWDGFFTDGKSRGGVLAATVVYNGNTLTQEALKPFAEGINIVRTSGRCTPARQLDVAFLVDATGSMDDEISYLKAELTDIIARCKDSLPGLDLRTGCLFYRDGGDDYLARISDFNGDLSKTVAFINDNGAGGGGDTPEGVDAALEEGLNRLSWRDGNTIRIAFLVLDAPPHEDAATVVRIQKLAAAYAARGIRLVPVVCSGAEKTTEYLMRSLALATNGTYLFLTDHSGIGGAHLAPTTDKYDVEYLNGLICRIIHQFAWMPDCRQQTVAGSGSDTARVVHQLPVTDSSKPIRVIQWRYYPNPTSGLLNVSVTGGGGELYVCDLSGKILYRFRPDEGGNATVDMTQYPAGVYFIRYYYDAEGMVSGRFTVVH